MRHFIFYFFITTITVLGSCVLLEPEIEPTVEYYNDQKPNANQIIGFQNIFGNNNNVSAFNFVEKSPGNQGYYVVGVLNNAQASININTPEANFESHFDPVLIRFDNQGNKLWEKRPGFRIYRHLVIPAGLLGNKEYILLSGYDNNEDDPADPDRNRFMLFDEDGTFVINESIDFYSNIKGAIIAEQTPEFVKILTAGGAYSSDNYHYPVFFEFKINKTNFQIYDFQATKLKEQPWRDIRFTNLLEYNGQYIVSGFEYDGGSFEGPLNGTYRAVHVASFNPQDLYNPTWRKNFENESPGRNIYHSLHNMHIDNGKIYLNGSFEDSQKASGGTYFESSFIRCFNASNGNLIWYKPYAISEYKDAFRDIDFANGFLFASGISSSRYCTSCTQSFTIGNAWICKINPASGVLLSSNTFGDSTYRTQISKFVLDQNEFWGFGYLGYTPGHSKGWVMRTNLSDL